MAFRKTRKVLKRLGYPIRKLVVSYKLRKRHEEKKAHFTKEIQKVGGLPDVVRKELSDIRDQITEALKKGDKKTADELTEFHNKTLQMYGDHFVLKKKHLFRHIPKKP